MNAIYRVTKKQLKKDLRNSKQAALFLSAQKKVLELITQDTPLPEVLKQLALTIEEQTQGILCSILLLKEETRLCYAAAPSLPEEYNQAIDGIEIGPRVGSCGTAAYRRNAVFVMDIATDPLWKDYRELALKANLRACWSVPFFSSKGSLLGTFAMYHSQPRYPHQHEIELTEIATYLARIAVENRINQDELKKHQENLETMVDKRTSELLAINKKLKAEIEEHEQARLALKESEKELQSSRQFLQNVFDGIQDHISTIDTNFNILHVNKAINKNFARSNFLGEKCYKVFHGLSEPCNDCPAIRSMTTKKLHTKLWETINSKGHTKCLELSTFPLLDEKQEVKGIIKHVRDVTIRKKSDEEFFKASKLESIGFLAGGIAHDFNNILTVILGNLSLGKLQTDTKNYLQYLEHIEKAALQAKSLTQQLLTFSKGGAPIKTAIPTEKTLKEAVSLALTGSNVSSVYSIPNDIWPVNVDEGQINQVINNFVINALQAMPEGGKIYISAENIIIHSEELLPLKPGKFVKITIRDEGVGIPPKYLNKIFDPYFTTKQRGSGLGLATSYSIITKHDGYITAESQMGLGTSFFIYLPAAVNEFFLEKVPKQQVFQGQGRILLMDDEKEIREVSGKMLSFLGYEVSFAQDGLEAIQIYQQSAQSGTFFDIIILDLTVPGGMGGKEAAQILRKMNSKVKLLVSSGYSNDKVIAHYQLHGFNGFIRKPFQLEEISKVVYDTINKIPIYNA